MKISRVDTLAVIMKYLCFILLVSAVCSAPVDDENTTTAMNKKLPEIVEIVESGSDHQIDGSYNFHYRGADGSFREETAVVKNSGTKQEFLEVTGAYSYFDSDGKEVVVHYKADDHGFVPVGSNIHESISVAARENSQLPAMDENVVDDNMKTI